MSAPVEDRKSNGGVYLEKIFTPLIRQRRIFRGEPIFRLRFQLRTDRQVSPVPRSEA